MKTQKQKKSDPRVNIKTKNAIITSADLRGIHHIASTQRLDPLSLRAKVEPRTDFALVIVSEKDTDKVYHLSIDYLTRQLTRVG